MALGAPAFGQNPTVLVSADVEGNALPCRTCPADVGTGGLAQRASIVADLRKAGPVLLVDTGNAFFGGDSAASAGKVIAAAYDAMAYDAVNVSYRDFRHGREATLAAVKDAKFLPLSANLIDEKTGQLLFKPYVVKNKVAILGVTDAPAGFEFLPHLKEQLAGVKVRPAVEAIAEWLPKAKAESDKVLLLYYGSGGGLRAITKKFGADLAAIAVGGLRPDDVPDKATPPIVASLEQGKSLGRLTLGEAAVTQETIPALQPPDQATLAVLAANKVPVKGVVAAEPPAATKPVLPRVTAKQPHEPKGIAGVGLTKEQIDKAVIRGCDFVWAQMQDQMKPNQNQLGGSYEGYHTIYALALVKSGFHKRNAEFNAKLRTYLAKVEPEAIGTYAAGTLCMLVEAYGDPQFEPVQRRAARYLFEGGGKKGWDYTPKVPESALQDPRSRKALQIWGGRPPIGSGEAEHWKRATTQPTTETEGDNSVAQYAVMGLQAAARAGVDVPQETWKQVLALFTSRQASDGGWGYVGAGSGTTGSMTCAATYGVAVARYNLGHKEPAVDEHVEEGLAWLAGKFSVEKNPGGAYHYYYLYSIERLGRTLDTEFIGPHEWYPLGAKYLITNQQPDGSWHEGDPDGHPDLTTSFALLFLARGTPKLEPAEVKREGPGSLRTALVQPPAPRVYFILDCSGSMHAEINGKPKFDLARTAVSQLMAELPDQTSIALRAYGHRLTAVDEGASEDTELLLQMGPMDRQKVADQLKKLRARGKTPLARSLTEAASDITGGEKVDVILLTDGGEDTLPRQNPITAAEALGKVDGVTLHIVGFDIGDPTWGKQLRDMAAAAKGRYWPAQDAASLLGELRAAVLRSPGGFEVLDAKGATVARGTFGETKPLEQGQYTFVTNFSGQSFRESFWVNAGLPTAVLFDAGKFAVSSPTTEPSTPAAPSAPVTPEQPKTVAKFCSKCGAKLNPAQKFCSSCGNPVAP